MLHSMSASGMLFLHISSQTCAFSGSLENCGRSLTLSGDWI